MRTKMTEITVTEGNDQFYPTPGKIAGKMLAGIDWGFITNILEPSAGKGDLVLAAIKAHAAWHRRRDMQINIDCIEIDPYLRAILKENHATEWVRPLREQESNYEKSSDTDSARRNLNIYEIRKKISAIRDADMQVIHDDFLTYQGFKEYQLILMNPPFSDGDAHLLKALEIQKDGGSIVCLLNAETLRNPFTNRRKVLMRELNKHEAKVTFLEDAFRDAERKADVDVAIVRVDIPRNNDYHSDIWERMEKAVEEEPHEQANVTDLVAGDYIEQAVIRFQVEVRASKDLIYQYYALKPYILEDLDPNASYNNSILTLSIERERSNYNQVVDMNRYLSNVRLKYWKALFKNEKFMGKLTSKLREEYYSSVEKMANYDFTLFNIRTIIAEMDSQIIDGVKGAIMSLFDKLTVEHSHYPETKQNIHLYNGWKTNKVHKIGKKAIIPTWGMFSSYGWKTEAFEVNTAYGVLSDIEKVFDYLSGRMNEGGRDMLYILQCACNTGQTRNIELKYFKVDLYKKGTTHIKFTDMELIEKFNIYAARNRNWLPPNYGKATYSEMTSEEKEVVESFQGEKAYEEVMARAEFYLSEPAQGLMMISEKSAVPAVTALDNTEEPEPVETPESEKLPTQAIDEAETSEYIEDSVEQITLF